MRVLGPNALPDNGGHSLATRTSTAPPMGIQWTLSRMLSDAAANAASTIAGPLENESPDSESALCPRRLD